MKPLQRFFAWLKTAQTESEAWATSLGDSCYERHEQDIKDFQEWVYKGDPIPEKRWPQ